jgi:hypothetical protein
MFRPDAQAIESHLDCLFGAVPTQYPGGLIEIRCIDPAKRRAVQVKLFDADPQGRQMARDFAQIQNGAGLNVYVGANPRKPSSHRERAASDDDVEIAFVQFVDLDSGADARDRLDAGRIEPCFIVTTGTVPTVRMHGWWELETPSRNMVAWAQTQDRLAIWFRGDPTVKNPSRIMRLAGTVSFPDSKKSGRGYRIERTTYERLAETDDGVPAEALAATYASQSPWADAPKPEEPGEPKVEFLSGLNTASGLLARIRADDHWHHNMIRLVAHWIGRGWSNVEILAASQSFTLPGYTHDQTRAEVLKAIEGGRRKWDTPDEEHEVEEVGAAPAVFPLLTIEDAINMPPPVWMVPGLLTEQAYAPFYGPSASLKSFIVLDLALRVAHGLPWMGKPVPQADVIYMAGEGAGGYGKRIQAWCIANGVDRPSRAFRLLPQAVNLLDPAETKKLLLTAKHAAEADGLKPKWFVVDTLARSMVGGDENSAQDMGKAIAAGADIQRVLGCAFSPVHHTGKDPEKGMRGSSALFGASDAVFKVTRSEDRVTLFVEKQKDEEDGVTYRLRTRKVDLPAAGIVPRNSLVIVPDDSEPTDTDEKRLLRQKAAQILGEKGRMTLNRLCVAMGMTNGGNSYRRIADAIPYAPDGVDLDLHGAKLRLWLARSGTAPNAPIEAVRHDH